MNLHNLSSSEFDAKLKEHLIDSSVPFDPESWDKMNQKLEVAFPGKDSSRNGIFELLIIAVLVSSLFFWNLHTFSQQNNTAAGLTPSSSTIELDGSLSQETPTFQESPGSPTTSLDAVKNGVQAQDQENYQASNKEAVPSDASAPSESIVVSKQSKPGPSSNSSQYLTNRNSRLNSSESNAPTNNTFGTIASAGLISTSEQLNTTRPTQASRGLNMTADRKESNIGSLLTVSSISPDSEPNVTAELPDSISKQQIIETVPVITQASSPWMLGFGYAPDISLVGFGETTSPGVNLGIMAEYQLNRRWSLNTGVAYSKKKYIATGDDYNPPEGFWDYGEVPDYTDAVCEVIEIPLNLRYYLRPAKAHRVFLSTGLSSYLMLTEDYHYQYQHNYDPDRLDSWSVENENQHFLSIYNLSIGYQRAIGARWFVEIEPFIKAPLAGVGFGEVDLWSTGSYFSIKYNFK